MDQRDIEARLLKGRVVVLGTPINDDVSMQVAGTLWLLERDDPKREIIVYVNSPGGSVTASMALYDRLRGLSCPVRTVCMGQAKGTAALLLAAGAPGARASLPNARIQLVAVSGGAGRPPEELLASRVQVTRELAACTGQTVEQVEQDSLNERAFSAAEARDYGLIDEIVAVRGQ